MAAQRGVVDRSAIRLLQNNIYLTPNQFCKQFIISNLAHSVVISVHTMNCGNEGLIETLR